MNCVEKITAWWPRAVMALLVFWGPVVAIADENSDPAIGPQALSAAFRNAARKATPSVVTILSYGQNMEDDDSSKSRDGDQDNSEPSEGQDDETSDESGNAPESNAEDGDEDDALPEEAVPGQPVPSPLKDDDGKSLPITGLGSGVILSSDGRIITNHHVIAGAKKVIVQLPDQTEFEAFDIHSDTESDVATLKVTPNESIVPATLGDSSLLDIGDWVLAIGSPFKLEATVSAGIISAKNRQIARISRGRLLQTDAAINPGNSGGPLIDLNGHVVAISTAIATRNGGYQGIGFAIPINQAKWIADELSTYGKVRRAAIGISSAELNKKVATKLNLPVGIGVVIVQVIEGSAAMKAGLLPLDVITDFAGEPVRQANDLREIIERMPIGTMQKIKVLRKGKELEFDVSLAPLEDPTAVDSKKRDSSDNSNGDADANEGQPSTDKSEPKAVTDDVSSVDGQSDAASEESQSSR